MKANKIDIIPYIETWQAEIDSLMLSISQEFLEPISIINPNVSNNTTTLPDLYILAISKNKVVGTIGLSKLKNGNAVLKKMFLHKDYRRKGIANLLLETITNWAMKNTIKTIYLGTMKQFVAAQKFYAKIGFEEISIKTLPIDFPINRLDTVFFELKFSMVKKKIY